MNEGRPEELLYSAEEHGKRKQMFKEIDKLKKTYPSLTREDLYEKAYQNVMKT
jgi:hypothetical protein